MIVSLRPQRFRWPLILLPFQVPPLFLWLHNDSFNLTVAAVAFTSLLFLGAGCMTALAIVGSHRLQRSIAPAYAALGVVLSWLFFLALVGSSFSNRLWGDNLTYEIAVEFLQRPSIALNLTPLKSLGPVSQKAVLYLAIMAISAALFCVFYWLAKVARLSELLERKTSRTAFLASTAAITFVAGIYWIVALTLSPLSLQGEPLTSFFMMSRTAGLMGWEIDRVTAALQDRKAAAEYPVGAKFEKRNIILILVESFRPDHLGVNDYERETTPFLSELMATGKLTLIDNAHSTCSESFCGIASVLASRPYYQISSDNFKLNNALRRNGYKVRYNLSGDHRTWRFLWDFYGDEVDTKSDPVDRGEGDSSDDRSMIQEFKSLTPFDGTPNFFYFFLMSTHFLGQKYPEFDKYKPSEFDSKFMSRFYAPQTKIFDAHGVPQYPPMPDEDKAIYRNRYDNGVLQADQMIRDIFSELLAQGYLKDSIVVIAGDHGESMGERGHILHARYLYEKDMKIPIFVYDDRGSKLANPHYATHIDIAPTILAKLGLPQPSSWQGRSLTEPYRPTLTVHQTRLRERSCVALLDSNAPNLVKYISCVHQNGTRSEEYFDLAADPGERTNLIDQNPAGIGALRQVATRRLNIAHCGGDGISCEMFSH